MTVMDCSIRLYNDLKYLPALHECVDKLAGQVGMSQTDLFQFKMALEEVIVNVINYAYPGQEGMPIDIDITVEGEICTARVTDSGIVFDPTQDATAPDLELSASDMPLGDLGVFLVKMYMQKIDYKRTDDGKNVLTLEYRIGFEPNL